jgi:uncharacterized membrane protein
MTTASHVHKRRRIPISPFCKDFSRDFVPGAARLFVLFRRVTPDTVLESRQGFKVKILKTNLGIDNEKMSPPVLEG